MPDSGAQGAVIEFLSRPESYGAGIDRVERIDTHGAIVFLAGDRVYKLKRAVRYPYMDYSTLERRRAMCEAEIAINRRTAPQLYLDAVPVTRDGGALRIDGDGTPVDWLVVMRRFDQACLFDRLAAQGRLTPDLMRELAQAIASFHDAAERRPAYGGADGIAWVIDGNRTGLQDAGPAMFEPDAVAAFDAGCRAWLARVGPLLDTRRSRGFVRRCHGDLHLRNICLLDGRPVLFDAIEFSEDIASIDTMYDFAFLLMDLERRRLRPLGNAALNAYLAGTGDLDGLSPLPLFLACRAGVRAQVGAAASHAQPDPARRAALMAEARETLALGLSFLSPPPARMIAVGGLSGTGKSTVARALAPDLGRSPGAVVLRSDEIRKRHAGVAPTVRLGPEAYTPEASSRVYAAMLEAARLAAAAGQVVILDAVFAKPEERAAAAQAARDAGVAFTGLWLEAPPERLKTRIASRSGDASDATVEVLARQLTFDLGPIDWSRIEVSGPVADSVAAARRLI